MPVLPLLSVGSRSDPAWLLEPHYHSLWKMLSFLFSLNCKVCGPEHFEQLSWRVPLHPLLEHLLCVLMEVSQSVG